MLFSRGQSRALLCLCAAAVLAHCGQSFEYEASTNSTLPSADYSKPDSPIPVFEDQAFAELASDFLLTQSSNTVPGRIDTHHHYVPSFYAEYLEQYNYTGLHLPWVNISWSADASLKFMDSLGIERAILSISTPGIPFGAPEEVRNIARRVNEYGGNTTKAHPSKFGFFAALPIPDINASLTELEYALDVLNASGVVLMANLHGKYLGDSLYEPLWTELDRRGTVVFVHPNALPGPPAEGVQSGTVDFLCDSSRTVASMLNAGVLSRFTRVRVIIPHAGAYVPYQAERIATAGRQGLSGGPERMAQLKRLYFDTAMSGNPYTLPSLMAFTSGHNITFGSDFPFAPNGSAAVTVDGLNDFLRADPMTLWRIGRGTALKLVSEPSSPTSS
ncbi:hypothetical protein CVIRNUC_009556 [Coccomyxa viridis]|uniref:Amidohydrolase-related domain-containing protein n=1 Tax=Coccomyxa viridis TaxID=1274662 RepID=A0AAV1IKA4_9CHLO|nr:hypothetical protein CVIRNUC_009556 [Coccomyxa viridis]